MKKIIKFLKKVVFSCFFLYSYNVLAVPLNIIIPINIINILILTVLGLPSLFFLILIHVLVF